MGVLYDYFAAGSDDMAAAAIGLDGGPAGTSPSGDGIYRSEHGFDVLCVKGVDPVVQLATLEALLTGRDAMDVIREPGPSQLMASENDGEQLVLRVREQLRERLAAATVAELDAVAEPWSRTEEFWGGTDPEPLQEFLHALAELSRRGGGLYCRVCV